MKRNEPFTMESLRRSTPEMRKIADAIEGSAEEHPYNMDYFGLETTEPGVEAQPPQTAVEAGVALGAARFALQTKQFPRNGQNA